MKEIKLNWARAPYLRSHNEGPGYTALLNFDCYVNQDIFALAKSDWVGYIMKNGKKTALYDSTVIESLLDKGYDINLDGIKIKSDNIIKNHSLNAQLLSLSESSTNAHIAKLAHLHNAKTQWHEQSHDIFKELDSLWGQAVKVEDAAKIGVAGKALKFTSIASGSEVSEQNYAIDLVHGVRQTMTYEEPSHEYFVAVYFYSTLKPQVSVEKLNEVAKKAQALPKKPTFDYNDKWIEGYDIHSFAPKKGDYRFKHNY